MSWFLGALRINQTAPAWASTLAPRFREVQSKYSTTLHWTDLESDNFRFLKASVGAFNDAGVWRKDSAFGTLAGEMLLAETIAAPLESRRTREAELLVKSLTENRQIDLLKSSRGTFACAAYDSSIAKLVLATDKLGVRPLYYFQDRSAVYFGTSLRDLLSVLPHRPALDYRAYAELLAFNYAFEDRTGLSGVKVLRPGTALRITQATGEIEESEYYDLRREAAENRADAFDPVKIFHTFTTAVRLRAGSETTATAFLSGGLDSRLVCGALRRLGHTVHTANFAQAESQDTYCSIQASNALGTRHSNLTRTPLGGGDSYSKISVHRWLQGLDFSNETLRPNLIWSGDGGSVGLGCVYITERSHSQASSGDLVGAMATTQPPIAHLGSLYRSLRIQMEPMIHEALRAEAKILESIDPAKALYLFLMRNDQRRHLYRHFDCILDGEIDFHLPFYDAEFIAAVLRQPITDYLFHKGYMRLLESCMPEALSAPFQAYPGHIPSPIPVPKNLSYQWKGRDAAPSARRAGVRAYAQCLRSYSKVADIVPIWSLATGLIMQLLTKDDYSYRARAARVALELRGEA